jgi:hypothetical protein
VLERAFDERDAALRPALAPLASWDPGDGPLEAVLGDAVDGYLRFLADHPHFVALVEREGLAGGARLRSTPHASSAMEDAFGALRRHTGWGFDVAEVVIAFVALCFFPLAHRGTFLPALGVDPEDPAFLPRRREQVVAVLVRLVRP